MDSEIKTILVSKIDISTSNAQEKNDLIAKEAPLHIFLGSIHLVSILSSPTKLKELVVGHLLSEGIVNTMDDIANLTLEKDRCVVNVRETDGIKRNVISKPFSRIISSSCGSVTSRSLSEILDQIEFKPLASWSVDTNTIAQSVKKLNTLANTFKLTGGVHVAALFHSEGKLVTLAEDVGRHNAVDKVIGAATLSGEDITHCFLSLSGRMTGDIVLKAARVSIPIIASHGATIDSGLEVAERTGITLIGFVRGRHMNIYSGRERIRL